MGDVQLNMDLSTVPPNLGGGRSYLPPSPAEGWLVKMVDANSRENSGKDGSHVLATVVALEGPVAGMAHDFIFNLNNKNPKAVEISKGELSAIGHCVGVMQLPKISLLFNLPFRIVTALDVAQQEAYPGATRVNKILSANGLGPLEAIKSAATNGNAFATAATGAPAGNAFATGAAASQPAAFQPGAAAAGAPAGGAFQPTGGGAPAGQAPQGGGFDPQTGKPLGQVQQQPQGQIIGYDQQTGAPIYGAPATTFQPQQQPTGVFQPQG